MVDAGRRAFFRGRPRPRIENRPPWARPEQAFVDACTRCDDCLKACPTGILVPGDGGYPTVDFSRGECTFCGDCTRTCASGALRPEDNSPPWLLKAIVGPQCLQLHGSECRVCGDFCEPRAIRFLPQLSGTSQLTLDASLCTGCGACQAPCPVQAIQLAIPAPSSAQS